MCLCVNDFIVLLASFSVEKLFESKLEISRRKGRPRLRWNKSEGSRRRRRTRLRWLEDVEKDLREMKVKRWRQKSIDREEEVSVVGESRLSEGVEPSSKLSK